MGQLFCVNDEIKPYGMWPFQKSLIISIGMAKRTKESKRIYIWLLAGLVVLVLVAVALLQVPPVKTWAKFYSLRARTWAHQLINPPGKSVFVPAQGDTVATLVEATMQVHESPIPLLIATEAPEEVITVITSETPAPTPLPSPTPLPIPAESLLPGIEIQYQTFNNCGPANLSMLLNYWGMQTSQEATGAVLRPGIEDRNVMLSEMLDYTLQHTHLKGALRYGTDLNVLKRLVGAGFPVLLERGYVDPKQGWMGHYSIIEGYSDAYGVVRIPDTLLGNMQLDYAGLEADWLHFANIFLVLYPPEREAEVMSLLGADADPVQNLANALESISTQTEQLSGVQAFFAWYSRGTILTEMQDYPSAAQAYDQAFNIYLTLEIRERPWRLTWYQIGPYIAYFHTARYQDTLNLVQKTLLDTTEDSLPETWLWGARAANALGQKELAVEYYQQALYWYPGWEIAQQELLTIEH